VVAVYLAVAVLGGWVPGIVFLNMAELVTYSMRSGSKAFVIYCTHEGDNQDRGGLSVPSLRGDKPMGVLSESQGGVGGLNLSMDGIEVGIGGDVMQ
jgi:hypothetical protein